MIHSRREFLRSGVAAGAALRGLPAWLRAAADSSAAPDGKKPNIILILADDLGFSDLGCYGGEIQTPNLDRLAAGGVRFTEIYNSARCCPSRASLLTGQYPHAVSFAGMSGSLPKTCVTIPEVLKSAGYQTLMSGKWHLGKPGPIARGFDEYFGHLGGYTGYWNKPAFVRLPKDRPLRTYEEGKFYATDAITDYAIDFIAGARKTGKPYFLYLAYTAPHFPLHAPKDLIDKYVKVYEQGWDVIRQQRYQRMKKMGLLDDRWPLSPRSFIPPNNVATKHGWSNKDNPAWDSIDADRRADLTRRMAIYAAMVDRMDQNIGRLQADLESRGELDNTLIVFLSDNGACAEWDPWGFDNTSGPENVLHKGEELDKMGSPGTYHSYGSGWANASNTPLRLYKHYSHEGGISSPFIVHWPSGMKRKGEIDQRCGHIFDILPTFAQAAGATYPKQVDDQAILPLEGQSLLPALAGQAAGERTLFFEHEGNRAVRCGRWKMVSVGAGPWELYEIDADRTEMKNLADQKPEMVKDFSAQYSQWARRVGATKPASQPAQAKGEKLSARDRALYVDD